MLAGRTTLALRSWHHVTLVREGDKVRVHLDGRSEPEIAGDLRHTVPAGEEMVFLGGRSDKMFGLEGKLSEFAVFPRALTAAEIGTLYQASGEKPSIAAAPPPSDNTPSAPLSPLGSLAKIHVRDGYGVELYVELVSR